jgi:hypothetical protein
VVCTDGMLSCSCTIAIKTINEIVDRTYTVHADFQQGDQLMFRSNAGKQCVAMSLCSIVYSEIKSVNIWVI